MRRWLAIVLVCAGSAPQAATVAVFTEPDFPFYIASPDYGPEFAAACLRQAGIECDEVAAAALADPAAFNAAKYRVLVQAYGNSFPVAAADNVRAFHAGGGCILALGGVPFCHPCTLEGGKWVDRIDTLGWNWIGHDRIGTGLWGDAAKVEELAHAAGDPLGLGWLPLPPAPGLVVQFPRPPLTNAEAVAGRPADDPRLLPEDTLTPVVSAFSGGKPAGAPVAIVHHHCPQFRGALDIWAGCTLEPSFTRQQAEQVVVASCAYLLRAAGAVDEEQRRRIVTAAKRRYVAPVSALPPAGAPFILRGPLPAKRLSVLDGTDMDAAELTCTLSLQGIVNRRQPRIYVIGQFQDRDWIEVLGKQGITGEEMASLEALLDRYRNEVAGAVITDPALPDTANIATMLAGLKHALVATPELAARLKLKPVMDLRGRWESGLEAYEWALRELWPKLKPRALACMAPSWAAPRDYLVQFPIFTFWLDCRTDKPLSAEQGSFFERVLASLPPRTAVYGWWQEGDTGGIGEWRGVHVSSQYGKITVCTVGAHNLSVHAGMPLPKPFRQLRPPAGGLDRKVYVSFLISDGDNFGMNLYAVVEAQWRQRMRGRVPVGWGICPTQVELTPALMDYWYRTASPMDEFIAMDGLGYIYPDDYGAAFRDPGAMLDDFLRESGRYMRRTNQRELWYLAGTGQAARMAKVLAIDGLLGEYGVAPQRRAEMLGRTAAIWVDVNPWEKPWDQVPVYVERIRARTPVERPAFLMVGVNGFAVGPDQIAQILSQLGPDYVAVRPDELCELYRRWKRQGVDAHPAPRPALDLTPPPASATTRLEGGALIVAEHSERPAVVGWYTDPRGTAWVRKRLHLDPPAGAREATIKAFVRGRAGNHVTFRVNGAEHVAVLPGAKWMWVEIRVPATELKDGENEIWYTGNPGGRLFTGGDPSLNLGHSDYGAPGTWTPLGGELLITVDVR